MKKNKTAELFLVLLILAVMSVGIFILQNGMEKLQKLETGLYLTEGERVMIGFSTCCRNSNGELCIITMD